MDDIGEKEHLQTIHPAPYRNWIGGVKCICKLLVGRAKSAITYRQQQHKQIERVLRR